MPNEESAKILSEVEIANGNEVLKVEDVENHQVDCDYNDDGDDDKVFYDTLLTLSAGKESLV